MSVRDYSLATLSPYVAPTTNIFHRHIFFSTFARALFSCATGAWALRVAKSSDLAREPLQSIHKKQKMRSKIKSAWQSIKRLFFEYLKNVTKQYKLNAIMNDLLSVVVPVYNNEKYLPKCIQSIIDQTYTNLEIFLVDDGSPDNCGVICDEFAKKDSRITVIHKKNEGVVIARNCGIERASGEYVAFVDSDDWIEPNMYEEMLQQGEGCDLISTGMYISYTEENIENDLYDLLDEGLYRKDVNFDAILKSFFLYKGTEQGLKVSMCNRLFRTSLLKKMYKTLPNNLKYCEDRLFCYAFVLLCETVYIISKSFYHYRMNDVSAMHSTYKYFLTDVETFYLHMRKIFDEHPQAKMLNDKLEEFVNYYILQHLSVRLGFSLKNQLPTFLFPFAKEDLQGLNIVLYGAGRVGQNYYNSLMRQNFCTSVLWVDKNATNYKQKYGYNVEQVSSLQNACYDAIIIAVKKEQTALSIKNELVANGVDATKIHWRAPIELFDIIYPRNVSQNDCNTQSTNFAPLSSASINRNGGGQ